MVHSSFCAQQPCPFLTFLVGSMAIFVPVQRTEAAQSQNSLQTGTVRSLYLHIPIPFLRQH